MFLKILHLPTEVGGNSWALAQGEKRIGLDSTVLVRKSSWLDYPCDIDLKWEDKSYVGMLLSGARTFFNIRKKYDVFHFNFGSSLIDLGKYGLPLMDIPFYPDDKKIVFTFNGCDARQKYKTIKRVDFSACHDSSCYGGICNNQRQDRFKEQKIRKAERYANHIFALNPDLMWFLPRYTTFLPYTVAEWDNIDPIPYKLGKKIEILHCPTNRSVKGSGYIMQALENLRKKYDIEITIVENMPHKKAIEVYKQADIVIDQVLVGWYGGLAVEVMKMGKPVAAFVREEDLQFIPKAMAENLHEAVININPSNIEESIEKYLQNPSLLIQKSQAVLEYVHKWHDPVYVAGITSSVYES